MLTYVNIISTYLFMKIMINLWRFMRFNWPRALERRFGWPRALRAKNPEGELWKVLPQNLRVSFLTFAKIRRENFRENLGRTLKSEFKTEILKIWRRFGKSDGPREGELRENFGTEGEFSLNSPKSSQIWEDLEAGRIWGKNWEEGEL